MMVAMAPIAASLAFSLRSLEEVKKPSIAIIGVILGGGLIIAHDFSVSPERVLAAVGSPGLALGDAARGQLSAANAAAIAKIARFATAFVTVISAAILFVPRGWLASGRGFSIVVSGMAAGLALRAYAYPILLTRLSPGVAWRTWSHVHAPGEQLGTLGVDPHAIPELSPVPLTSARAAAEWLSDGRMGARRYVAFASAELPLLNATFRGTHRANVPILAGGDGAVMLAASSLASGERNENPLDAIVLDAPPEKLHPIDATLGGRLDMVGWELRDTSGRPADVLRPGSRAHLRLVLRVRPAGAGGGDGAESMGAYCTFVHIDHTPSRFSAEHRTHPYPMALWRSGDVIVDDFEVVLPAHFRAGRYALWWGIGVLPCVDDRRMSVTSGPNDGHDRVSAGSLELR